MNNKKIYEDKIKPLSSFFIDYYGEEYSDRINKNFNSLVYNFDDIFTSSYDLLSNSPVMIKGLIENYHHLKAKEQYNNLFNKFKDLFIKRVKIDLNIDLSNNYDLFINNYFSFKSLEYILHDDKKLYDFSSTCGINSENIQNIHVLLLSYRDAFYKSLLKIDYFKKLYKKLNCNFGVFINIVDAIFNKNPFVARYKDREDNIYNYLYFPYLNYLNNKSDMDMSLLHELVHLSESNETKDNQLRIGLNYNNNNVFVNEIRTDKVALHLKEKVNKSIFETRDVPCRSTYLTAANEFLYYFDKYDKVLSKIAISGDLDRLTYLFGNDWNDFSLRMDDLYELVMKEICLTNGNNKHICINYNTDKIHSLINNMDNNASNKILILERK